MGRDSQYEVMSYSEREGMTYLPEYSTNVRYRWTYNYRDDNAILVAWFGYGNATVKKDFSSGAYTIGAIDELIKEAVRWARVTLRLLSSTNLLTGE